MTEITFTGDIAFSKYFKDHWQKDFLSGEIMDFLSSSDHVVANVEAPLTTASASNGREINHFSHPESALWLKNIFADVWTIANNHILDGEEKGMEDTIKAAKSVGSVTLGAGKTKSEAIKPVCIDNIGILAVTYKRGEFIPQYFKGLRMGTQ